MKEDGRFLGFEGDAAKKARKALIISLSFIAAAVVIYFAAVLIYRGNLKKQYPASAIEYGGETVCERFRLPEGFERLSFEEGSDEYAVQHLSLKKFGLGSYFYDSGKRNFDAGLWGVVDGDKVKEFPVAVVLPAVESSTPAVAASMLENAGYVKVEKTSEILPGMTVVYSDLPGGVHIPVGMVADVCVNEEGRVLFLLLATAGSCEPFIYCGYDGTLLCWKEVDLSSVAYVFYYKK
jgi:hypothetical protein